VTGGAHRVSVSITGKKDRSELALRHFTGTALEVKTDVQTGDQVISTGKTQAKKIVFCMVNR
jgi:hypothetical protein